MNTKLLLILLSGALTHLGAWAHEGHGLPGSGHWHATDTLGFVGLAVVAAAVWFINKRK
jgi:hypothetical protein